MTPHATASAADEADRIAAVLQEVADEAVRHGPCVGPVTDADIAARDALVYTAAKAVQLLVAIDRERGR
jgi:hypothetical protein